MSIDGVIFLIAFVAMTILIIWAILGVMKEIKKSENNPAYKSDIGALSMNNAPITQPSSSKNPYATGILVFIFGVLLWWFNYAVGYTSGYGAVIVPPMTCGFGLLLLYRTYLRKKN